MGGLDVLSDLKTVLSQSFPQRADSARLCLSRVREGKRGCNSSLEAVAGGPGAGTGVLSCSRVWVSVTPACSFVKNSITSMYLCPFLPSNYSIKISVKTHAFGRQTEGARAGVCSLLSLLLCPVWTSVKLPGQAAIACSTVRLSPRTGLPTSGPEPLPNTSTVCLHPLSQTDGSPDRQDLSRLTCSVWCWRDGESGQAVEDKHCSGLWPRS